MAVIKLYSSTDMSSFFWGGATLGSVVTKSPTKVVFSDGTAQNVLRGTFSDGEQVSGLIESWETRIGGVVQLTMTGINRSVTNLNAATDYDELYDLLFGGRDDVFGSAFDDNIGGGNSADHILGNAGNDTLWGQNGNDTVDGGSGRDNLLGGLGNDKLYGGKSSDYLQGDEGDDRLFGGSGDDVFDGGSGADTFVFLTARETFAGGFVDTIYGFTDEDVVDLRAIDARAGGADDAFRFRAAIDSPFTGVAGQLVWNQVDQEGTENDFTHVYGDVNGDGVVDLEIAFAGLITLTASDFLL